MRQLPWAWLSGLERERETGTLQEAGQAWDLDVIAPLNLEALELSQIQVGVGY